MKRIDNQNRTYRPPDAAQFTAPTNLYMRQTLDRNYQVWSAAFANTARGNGYKWFALGPNMNAGSGTTVKEQDDARQAVDRFMDKNVHAQQESGAGHTLPTERLQYINGELTIIDHSAQWNRYFPVREQIAQREGSVGTVEAAPTGLGKYYLRRFKRINGMLREERPAPEREAFVMPLVQLDIDENYWGEKTYAHSPFPVAADVSNALFEITDPPYSPRRLSGEDEAIVLSRRSRGLEGDPVKGKPNEEERLNRQMQQHLDDRAILRDQL